MISFIMEMWPRLVHHTLVTCSEVLWGSVCGLLLALLLTWGMWASSFLRKGIELMLVLIQSLPMFVLAPLLLLVFGFTPWAIIIPTALMIAFPLTLGLHKGLRATPEDVLGYYRSMGVSPIRLFLDIRLPYAVPVLLASARVAASNAALCAVAGEWAGGQEGLGVFIQEMRRNYDLFGVLWGIVSVLCLSLLLYGAMVWVERYCLRRFLFTLS